MLRPDILDMIDELCQQARGSLALFGGLQVILIGDLCQLPPIIKPAAIPAFKQKYGTAEPYFLMRWPIRKARLKNRTDRSLPPKRQRAVKLPAKPPQR